MQTFDSSPGDLQIPSEGLTFQVIRLPNGTRDVSGSYGAAEAGQDVQQRIDDPRTLDDFSSGMGASQANDAVPGGYAYARNLCTRFPHSVMPSGLQTEVSLTAAGISEITASFEQDGHLYFVAGRYVLRIANGTDPGPISAAEQDLGSGFSGTDAVLFDGAAYIAGTGGNIWRKAAGGAWSQSADVALRKLATVYWVTGDGSGSYRLIGADSTTTFRHIPSGSTVTTLANWSASIKVANTSYPINSIVASNQHVWFCTSGGVADVNGLGYSPILNPYFGNMRDDTLNGAVSLYHDGYLYVSHLQGLDRLNVTSQVRDDSPEFCMPGADLSNETPVYGRCTALTAEGGWVVAAFYNGTDSYICYGKDKLVANKPVPGPMVWHAEAYIAGERITHLRVASTSPASNPCIWIASVSGSTPKLRYLSIPKAATPLQEYLNNLNSSGTYTGTHRWATSGSLYLSDMDWNDQSWRKILTGYYARLDKASPTSYLRVFARTEGGDYVQQGAGSDPRMARSPRSELLSVQAGLDTTTKGHNIGIRLDFVGTSTAPLVLREFKVRAQVKSELRETRRYAVILGNHLSRRNGTFNLTDDMMETWNSLTALQSREPLDVIDEKGASKKMTVNPGLGWSPARLKQDGVAHYQDIWIAEVLMTVIPTSNTELALDAAPPDSTPQPSNVFVWGQSVWGGGDVWGRRS